MPRGTEDTGATDQHGLLRKALASERRLGFKNTAVIGGLDLFVLGQMQTVHPGVVPLLLEFGRYRALGEEDRRRLIDDLERQLDAPPAPTSPGALPLENLPAPPARARRASVQQDSPPAPPQEARRVSSDPLDAPLMYLKGVGPRRAEALEHLGLKTVYDLLQHFPARYEDRSQLLPINRLHPDLKQAFCATVLYEARTQTIGRNRRQLTRLRVGDDSGQVDLQWWNQAYREQQFRSGMKLYVYGKVIEFRGGRQVDSPEFEILDEDAGAALQVGRIVPVYPAGEGLFQGALRKAVQAALDRALPYLLETLPPEVIAQHDLMARAEAFQQMHFPTSEALMERARRRLIFEEFFLMQIALAQRKSVVQQEKEGVVHRVDEADIRHFVKSLPFTLTGAQRRVMREIWKDLQAPRPMNRLLHGDVGSGKTVVAAYGLWTAHATGHQGALLAPTEILAEQHYAVLQRLLEPLGVPVALLEGSLPAREKRRIQADVAEGRTSVVVGTHALIQQGVQFRRLSVCVVDEQHRFGVLQRAALQQKGHHDQTAPDVLVMTATPIPRTLALTVFGDLEVSTLDELPPGRTPVHTVALKPGQRDKAYRALRERVTAGQQAYVVCPLVEESEKLVQLKAATALAERLQAEELRGLRVGLLHGQMSLADREAVMDQFRQGLFHVLVATTVIEVGVDVPNAAVMVIEDADRFGLSQLHQLRGRVGRGAHTSVCFLLGEAKSEIARARLEVMVHTNDGFEIAQQDLQLRGPGEFYGTRQSGLPDLHIADLVRDEAVLQAAREAAFAVIAADPQLEAPGHQTILPALRRFWGERLALVRIG